MKNDYSGHSISETDLDMRRWYGCEECWNCERPGRVKKAPRPMPRILRLFRRRESVRYAAAQPRLSMKD